MWYVCVIALQRSRDGKHPVRNEPYAIRMVLAFVPCQKKIDNQMYVGRYFKVWITGLWWTDPMGNQVVKVLRIQFRGQVIKAPVELWLLRLILKEDISNI